MSETWQERAKLPDLLKRLDNIAACPVHVRDDLPAMHAAAAESAAAIRALLRVLLPFAKEGEKWRATAERHDGLRMLIAEDYVLMERRCRCAEFTIGDLKRAAISARGTT